MNPVLVAAAGGIASGVISAILSAFLLTLKYSERLASIERGLLEQDKRMDRLEQQIFGALRRIEDKIDRKQDRP
ncbi:hypothetical protein [Dyella caseinilytica]|uniref:Uncharacterized protein n=1 Tax=Dyella caseinilytica TaxID=1849581 RepID=A0ABX7GXL9_9GAMM|nr:hypothetical protein [Dyella caseinilytica]QRN55240.1 hypothetical protein ISN74_07895 [Dyella caseinilytica]GGA00347.1 hypothetical protein GCM10011408_21570 [Dyella caseinilytica]